MVADRRGGRVQRSTLANAATSGAKPPLAPPKLTPERRSGRKRAKLESQLEIVLDGATDAPLQQEDLHENGAPATSTGLHGTGLVNGETPPAANGEAASLGKTPSAKSEKESDVGDGEYAQLLASRALGPVAGSEWVPVLPQIESQRPGLLALLSEFRLELEELAKANKGEMKLPSTPFTNASYLKHLELAFVLRAQKTEIYRALKMAVARGAPTEDPGALPEARQHDLEVVERLLKAVEMVGCARLQNAPEAEQPLVYRLSERYPLSGKEKDLLKLLFVKGGSSSLAFNNILGLGLGTPRPEDRDWEMLLCGLSAIEMDEFLDDKRVHMLEGIVMEVEDYDGKNLKMVNDAVSVLLGNPIRTEQRLKLSRTELLNIMDSAAPPENGARSAAPDVQNGTAEAERNGTSGGGSEVENVGVSDGRKKGTKRSRKDSGLEDDLAAEFRALEQGVAAEGKRTPPETNGMVREEGSGAGLEKGEKSDLQPYQDSLEYLDDSFQVLALQMRVSKARHQEDLKEAGNAPGGWYDGYNYKNSKAPSTRELKAKLKFAQTKLRERLAVTEEALKKSGEPPADVILPVGGESADVRAAVTEKGADGDAGKAEANAEIPVGNGDASAKVEAKGKKADKKDKSGDAKAKTPVEGTETAVPMEQDTSTVAAGASSDKIGAVSDAVKDGEVKDEVKDEVKGEVKGEVKDGPVELPRLEALARKLGLDEFEKGVVTMLTGVAISPVVKSIYEADDGGSSYRRTADTVQVKDILTVFLDTFKDQVSARPYFYKSSRLVSKALIKIRPPPYTRNGGDLMDQQVELDRRMLDWIVGLDTEMNELVEGSHLYHPKISMDQVVLPEEQKAVLLRTVDNYAKFKQYRHTAGLEDVINYGAGLVILLCGASGTGKTMTVNAVAHHLGKRVLLVDFQSLSTAVSSGNRGEDQGADLRGLFRDAEMNDAVIFFDECEAIFAQRERGGDRLLNALLTEMERHEGIIMLATNRPLDLDEAMHRRITCVSEFRHPDHTQRRLIWELSSRKLPLAEALDWEKIALRYELTGGYIKNALVSALLLAISRSADDPKVTEDDIVEGCQMQMRGSLQMKAFLHRVVPKTGLDDLVLSSQMRKQLESIVNFEKARAVMVGSWGFAQERVGTAALFWGIHGSGKSAAAEAIGFELGRPLKVINCAQLVSQESSSKTGSAITATFKDARLMDAVLVLEDFQVIEGGNDEDMMVSRSSSAAIGLLLYNLERFPGVCILIANNIQSSAIRRLDPELMRRLRVIVEFKMPDAKTRGRMWRKLLPDKVPLAPGIDFDELGRRFEFNSGAISGATVRAAAKVALRPLEERVVTQKDLMEAAEAEKDARRDEIDEVAMRAFI